MAWNPSPEVQVARDAAARLGDADQVMIVALNKKAGTLQLVTYGRDKRLCADAKLLGDAAYGAVMAELKRRAGIDA